MKPKCVDCGKSTAITTPIPRRCRKCSDRFKTVPKEQRFWKYVEKTSNCWVWIGSLQKGYGQISNRPYTTPYKAHRLSWEIHYGKIPKGKFVCHHCDNRRCIRPDHLFVGTAKDNVQDMVKKGKARGKNSHVN